VLVIPAVDVLDGAVVRLLHGRFDAVTSYATDPVGIATRWADEGATLVHVVDLEGARTGGASKDLWRSLGQANVTFQVGGGIRSAALAREAVAAGAERVVVGSAAVHDGVELRKIVEAVDPERVVAALDVRAGRARGTGWLDGGTEVDTVVGRIVDAGIRHTLVTGIDRDGAMQGPNVEVLGFVENLAPELDLIASGGVGSLADLSMLSSRGYAAAIVGRALYEHRFTLAEAIEAAV
jgi:phosphoribosylformimino-5-aminoimidazole carboxamide ribotide isomerase